MIELGTYLGGPSLFLIGILQGSWASAYLFNEVFDLRESSVSIPFDYRRRFDFFSMCAFVCSKHP